MLTHGNLASNIRQVLDHPGLALTADDVTLGALPFFHVFGLNAVLGISLAAGATTVLPDQFDAAGAVRAVRDDRVTVIAGVPAMYHAFLALDDTAASSDSFASVRLAVSGAAPLGHELFDGMRKRFDVVVHEGYGLTEASPIVTTSAIGRREPAPGSIGPPLPGIDVRLVDADGTDVLPGDPGEIWLHGPNVFPGYWRDPEATARALTPDGWLRTGDIAVMDDAGELSLVDRAKDLVIVSGFNVYPAEVEEVLLDHPDVAEAAVVGEPDPRTGEAVVAFVVAEPGRRPDPDALLAHCTRSLARYKCPARVEVVDALPRSFAGKVLRRELRPD
jgi:long-chain acyl-CoA synthetase